jgi:saccharopine dehydrogenase-like NADP-dependent oxidoreductase
MKKILLIGAGRSASSLIDYLLKQAEILDWHITIGDLDPEATKSKIGDSKRVSVILFDAQSDLLRSTVIPENDLVISMLPATMHVPVAKDCIRFKKHMVTASYVSDEMRELHKEAVAAGVTILNEIGVDPGIDHMSAMKVLDELRHEGAEVFHFETFTGGLPAPESDDNPWHYKFFWNPKNVVMAGQGAASKFLHEGSFKYIPYQRVFRRTERVNIPDYGIFEGYANRDSLKYREAYGLQDAKTIYRGTFRRPGFSRAWNVLVQLGATDDSYHMEDSEGMTNRDFINSFLYYHPTDSVETKVAQQLHIDLDSDEMMRLEWLGIFNTEEKQGLKNATPAQMLLSILEKRWTPSEQDKDMIVMWHRFVYNLNGERKEKHAYLVTIGDNKIHSAMSKTVGLPVGIAAKLLLENHPGRFGVLIPVTPEIYNPVLDELETLGIKAEEKQIL